MAKPDLSVKVRPQEKLTRADLIAREWNTQEIVDHHQAVIRGLRDEVERLKAEVASLRAELATVNTQPPVKESDDGEGYTHRACRQNTERP